VSPAPELLGEAGKTNLQTTLPRSLYRRPENRLPKATFKKIENKALLKSLAENCKQLNYYENQRKSEQRTGLVLNPVWRGARNIEQRGVEPTACRTHFKLCEKKPNPKNVILFVVKLRQGASAASNHAAAWLLKPQNKLPKAPFSINYYNTGPGFVKKINNHWTKDKTIKNSHINFFILI